MKNNIKAIIDHFGIKNQQKKLTEEIHELNEAITTYEVLDDYIGSYTDEKHHIAEEITDCMLLLYQIKLYYNISEEDILKISKQKIDRTIKRMESGYYAKK